MILASPPPDRVPGLESIAAAWRLARRTPANGPAFAVGVCDDANKVVSAARFDGFDQVQKFSREMARLGYAALIVGSAEEMQGCDVIYVRQSGARDIFDPG